MPEPRIDQCKCGVIQQIPPGELKHPDWQRMRDGSLRCPKCQEGKEGER